MTLLYCDIETHSPTPIKSGTHRYAEKAEVLLWTYAIDDGPVYCWDVASGAAMPMKLASNLYNPQVMTVWHNGGMFDTVVLKYALRIDIPMSRVHDTMVQALCHSLPGALGALCEVLKVPVDQSKDKAGRMLIRRFCMPQKVGKVLRYTQRNDPEGWAKFIEYAKMDIEAMREVYKRLPTWNYKGFERSLWELDQKINRRGVCIDMELVQGALAAVEKAQTGLAADVVDMTNDEVQTAGQRDKMLEHILSEYGIALPDMRASTLERRINDPDVPQALKDLLNVRLQASSTSTAKYKALDNSVNSDGRLRGTLQFCGASRTGRWAGRLFQPQNLTRPTISKKLIPLGIESLKANCTELVFDDVMAVASSCLRACIIPSKGKKLVVSDLSNIEGRVQAWISNEDWKLQAFKDFDNGTGHDLYALSYAKSFGVSPESVMEDKERGGDQRQIGKTMELALGFGGGVGAFVTFATAFNIDLEVLKDKILENAPGWTIDEASGFYDWVIKKNSPTFGLSRDAYVACDALKRAWRAAHPNIIAFWSHLKTTIEDAINTPGVTFECGRLKIRRDGTWLRVGLPSGRALCYPSILIEDGQVSYMGMNQYSRKWQRIRTYFGKSYENIVQGIARDVMAANMPLAEDAGFEIGFSSHDELVTEAPDDPKFSASYLSQLLATVQKWGVGLPLKAAGYESKYYKKD